MEKELEGENGASRRPESTEPSWWSDRFNRYRELVERLSGDAKCALSREDREIILQGLMDARIGHGYERDYRRLRRRLDEAEHLYHTRGDRAFANHLGWTTGEGRQSSYPEFEVLCDYLYLLGLEVMAHPGIRVAGPPASNAYPGISRPIEPASAIRLIAKRFGWEPQKTRGVLKRIKGKIRAGEQLRGAPSLPGALNSDFPLPNESSIL